MTTYDLEKGLRVTIEAKVIEEGCYIINAQKFNQTMRVMDGGEVSLTVDHNMNAVIESGRSSHKMIAMKGSEFPELPMLESERGFSLSAGILREMLGKTMYAMGVNDQRPVLNGTFFEVSDNGLLLVSCDSFKLAKCRMTTDVENKNADGSDLRYRFIVPVKTVSELYKLISGDPDAEVRIHMMRKHIIFYIGDLIFFSRLVDGEYIDFDRIIIRQHKIYITLDREELISALDRAALITEERVAGSVRSHVKLQLEGGLLKILAASAAGSTYDEIEINDIGAPLTIGFNNRYLINSVRACNSERIKLSLSSHLSSLNITPAEAKEGIEEVFMLLPVRLKD
jgi:DNA polymerase-3 subunit beta